MLKLILKRVMITLFLIIGILFISYLLFTNFYPSFGADISKKRQQKYALSNQFRNGIFNNTSAVPENLGFTKTVSLAYTYFTTKVPNSRPKLDLKVIKLDSSIVANYTNEARMVWFGHSSFLLQIAGKNILLDPMFGDVAAPHPLLGAPRFNKRMPLALESLPQIDAVLFSHDHYDHLDYETIIKLKNKVTNFYVPLGVGAHLEAWGVATDNITELDWWEEIALDNLTLICTPAQHFSGRKFNNKQSTLWSSWVIKSDTERIFFSGDSGYGSHFKSIGEKYGPFDLALLECGQYNEMWPDIHMMPEETAQAALDIKAEKMMPIHWGGFKLALHEWTDPVVRLQIKASELNVNVITPKIGESIPVKDNLRTYDNWWEGF